MKMKLSLIPLIFILALGIIFSVIYSPSLSEKQAFVMVWGNYDDLIKSATWLNIPFSDRADATGYWEKKRGIVRSLFFQPYYENGKDKVFLLTKTIPTNIPFDCHACLPLIGAAVFVKKNAHWEIEAQNQFIMYDGEYGELPTVKLISVGKDKIGVSLEFEHVAATDRELHILMPYKNIIVNAHTEMISYKNFSECAFSRTIQCVASVSRLAFDKTSPGDYYGLKVKRFGTVYSEEKNKTMPVDEEVTYQFLKGHYVQMAQKGVSTMEWAGIHRRQYTLPRITK